MEISKEDLRILEDTWYSFAKGRDCMKINNKVKDGMVNDIGIYSIACMNYETLLYCVKHLGVKE